jgi:hypothetical protein
LEDNVPIEPAAIRKCAAVVDNLRWLLVFEYDTIAADDVADESPRTVADATTELLDADVL